MIHSFLLVVISPAVSVRILLANSMGQNRCGKICSHRSANSDKKRALVLSISTKIRGMIHSFLLVVISPAVSRRPWDHPFGIASRDPEPGLAVSRRVGM